ncbi:alpha/beta fold hydrolase [Gymnodinialimonas hymeniacidonis]|uniref:alpha/beta fold hydrolase n=1 Tax=Gymnodinialimonas hymeniacidonis TaxID=3126508 RepID=UPI0034C6CEE4
MSVRHWGQGAEPALLLHCTLAHGGAWAGVARHLAHRLTMSAPDLLAHGAGPEADRNRDFHDQASEAAARHLPDAPAHLIGHSFGATLALRLAVEAPERVRSLTLIEPVLFCAADGPGRAAHDAHFAPLAAAMTDGDLAEAARVFLGLWGTEDFDDLPKAQQRYIIDRIWIPEATEPALIQDRAALLPRLGDLYVPTLLIEGAHSPPVINEINTRLALGLPNATRVRIAGASHMAPITHPAETAAAIDGFL